MVVDTLDNLEKYVSLNPLFADVVKFIKDNDLSKLETVSILSRRVTSLLI